MDIYLAADHRGFALKQTVIQHLGRPPYHTIDCGNTVYDDSDDFVDYVVSLASRMVDEQSRGIVICGSGCGVSLTANRFPHIRATVGWTVEQVTSDCHDDHVNVLALSADYVSVEQSLELVDCFLSAPWGDDARFLRRLEKLRRVNLDGSPTT